MANIVSKGLCVATFGCADTDEKASRGAARLVVLDTEDTS